MTGKRFEVTFNGSDFHLNDNETGEELKLVDEKVCYDYIADRWNALHEENQSSKEFIEQLQGELVLFKKAGADMGNDLNAQITALKQENEQLHEENKRLQRCINEIYTIARLEEV